MVMSTRIFTNVYLWMAYAETCKQPCTCKTCLGLSFLPPRILCSSCWVAILAFVYVVVGGHSPIMTFFIFCNYEVATLYDSQIMHVNAHTCFA